MKVNPEIKRIAAEISGTKEGKAIANKVLKEKSEIPEGLISEMLTIYDKQRLDQRNKDGRPITN